MFRLILKDETRFWRIFLRLLIPTGAFALLLFGIAVILTLTGKNVVRVNDEPVSAFRGIIIIVAVYPICVLVWTLPLSVIALVRQRIRLAIRK